MLRKDRYEVRFAGTKWPPLRGDEDWKVLADIQGTDYVQLAFILKDGTSFQTGRRLKSLWDEVLTKSHNKAVRFDFEIDDLPASPGFESVRKAILGRSYWLVRGQAYSTTEKLTADEVFALVVQKEKAKERKIARALAEDGDADTDRARMPIPDDVKMFVWRRDGGRCVKCGSNENLEYDHIIPLAKGGSNTNRNIQLLCENCNRSKGAELV